MSKLLLMTAMLVVVPRIAPAQSITGTWQVDGPGPQPWVVILRATGRELSGSVSTCASDPGSLLPVQISDGRVDGNAIRFTCDNVNRSQTVTFTAVVNGDELTLRYEQRARDGQPLADRPADPTGLFGASSPTTVVAKRVTRGGIELGAAVNLVGKNLKVEGALFLPRSIGRVRSILVGVNSGTSWNGLAATLYADAEVRAFAATHETGLLLLRVTPLDVGGFMFFVTNPAAGADEALILLLNRLASDSGRSEIATAPLAFWGHSAAGPFGSTFARTHPNRTAAFVRYHSGDADLVNFPVDSLKHVPALILQAGQDNPLGNQRAHASWQRGRAANAPWTFGVEPEAVHQDPEDVRKANALLLPWLSAVLNARVARSGGALRPAPAGQLIETNWFPDEVTAKAWRSVATMAP